MESRRVGIPDVAILESFAASVFAGSLTCTSCGDTEEGAVNLGHQSVGKQEHAATASTIFHCVCVQVAGPQESD